MQQLTDRVKFLHKVTIIRSSEERKEVLLLKRSAESTSRPNCWDLPGGNAEWPASEQVSVADLHQFDVAREIKEESNLTVKETIFDLAHLLYFSSYFDATKQIYTIICGWCINLDDTDQAEIKISHEHQDFSWANAKQLDSYDFGGVKGEFIKTMVERAFN